MPQGSPGKIEAKGITSLRVQGYKSIVQARTIEIRNLTLLAGANSSGKSSIMQPALLLKQTLEASYDPGPLLINGPNVRFTSLDQFFSRQNSKKSAQLEIGIGIAGKREIRTVFGRNREGLQIERMDIVDEGNTVVVRQGMTHQELTEVLSKIDIFREFPEPLKVLAGMSPAGSQNQGETKLIVERDRCFLEAFLERQTPAGGLHIGIFHVTAMVTHHLRGIIHVPAFRGNPERAYPVTAVGDTFSGTFDNYTASVIAKWQKDPGNEQIKQLWQHLRKLGLTWKLVARPIDDTQVELEVSRLIQTKSQSARDLVNVADVGFGVSQILPCLVALLAAKPGQIVYLEQPEIHLHPRALVALAELLAEAANRRVQVVVETHSALLLLSIQTLVAEGKLNPTATKLHWFKRDESGITNVETAELDRAGAFGDWPEDFGQVMLDAEKRYLNSTESVSKR